MGQVKVERGGRLTSASEGWLAIACVLEVRSGKQVTDAIVLARIDVARVVAAQSGEKKFGEDVAQVAKFTPTPKQSV